MIRDIEYIHQRIYSLWLWDRNFDRDFRDVLIKGANRPCPWDRFFWCF